MYLPWEVGKEKVELSQCLFILELEMKMIDVLEDWKVVGSIHHEDCGFDLL